MDNIEEAILRHRFFKQLNPDFLPLFAGLARALEYKPGQLIFKEGDDADRFYLIDWGCVGIETKVAGKRPAIVQRIGVGEALGWSWFFPPFTWRFSARCIDSTELIVFDAAALRSIVRENTAFGYDLSVRIGAMMQDRLQAARALLADYCVEQTT